MKRLNWSNRFAMRPYVILDDDSDMLLSQKKHIIKTHALRGISKRDVKRAINILTKTKSI